MQRVTICGTRCGGVADWQTGALVETELLVVDDLSFAVFGGRLVQ